jgi:hypothetical protein
MVSAGQWDTIKGRLGYRYQVTQVNYPTTAAPGEPEAGPKKGDGDVIDAEVVDKK